MFANVRKEFGDTLCNRNRMRQWTRHLSQIVPHGHRWIPLAKASNTELWYFLWFAPEQTVEQTIETLVIWGAIALIMTLL